MVSLDLPHCGMYKNIHFLNMYSIKNVKSVDARKLYTLISEYNLHWPSCSITYFYFIVILMAPVSLLKHSFYIITLFQHFNPVLCHCTYLLWVVHNFGFVVRAEISLHHSCLNSPSHPLTFNQFLFQIDRTSVVFGGLDSQKACCWMYDTMLLYVSNWKLV